VKLIGGLGVVLVLATAGCASAPEPVDYMATLMAPCPNGDETPWVIKAVWDDGDTYVMASRFETAGVMAYAYTNRDDESFDNARWSIAGTQLKFDMNDHYADYEGTFDGAGGKGTMKNVTENFGEWVMTTGC